MKGIRCNLDTKSERLMNQSGAVIVTCAIYPFEQYNAGMCLWYIYVYYLLYQHDADCAIAHALCPVSTLKSHASLLFLKHRAENVVLAAATTTISRLD
jgi:hypothetical protein